MAYRTGKRIGHMIKKFLLRFAAQEKPKRTIWDYAGCDIGVKPRKLSAPEREDLKKYVYSFPVCGEEGPLFPEPRSR